MPNRKRTCEVHHVLLIEASGFRWQADINPSGEELSLLKKYPHMVWGNESLSLTDFHTEATVVLYCPKCEQSARWERTGLAELETISREAEEDS